MDVEKWKAALQKSFSKDRRVKFLVLLGLCGVVLIYLSGMMGNHEKPQQEKKGQETVDPAETYREQLEQGIAKVVRAITGEEAPVVMITLESGSRYVYAADEKQDVRESGEEADESRETAHVLLKDSDGNQRALTVTEIQPEVKGVVIVSRFAGDPAVREKLTDAVRTALDVSSARVCVTDTG